MSGLIVARGTRPRWVAGTLKYRPHIFLNDGVWWVLYKHGNRTGPYHFRRTAFAVARDIWAGAFGVSTDYLLGRDPNGEPRVAA
jgi:hypothetical protein